ncbi:MTH1187 family thiamine-binding protein [Sulfurimonas sp. HSL1-2]|uniref:MTH1187 family thiamine-binding protein n=1 Tax=Thiomicrolovo zhangzhouensis TaxID=3131933 RepID=UPI0031F832FC
MFPTSGDCRDGASVSAYVSRIIDMIDRSGLPYQLTPMGTIVETGSVKEALAVVEKAYDVLGEDCERVYSSLKLDIRKGKAGRLKGKIDSVQRELGRDVSH